MVKANLFGGAKATLWDFFRGDKGFDFAIRCGRWATVIIPE